MNAALSAQRAGVPRRSGLRQVLVEAVFRRKGIFTFVVLALMAAVVAATVLMPRQYQSQAKLIVQNVRQAVPLTAAAGLHQATQDDVSQAEINSEADLLQSPMVAQVAVGAPVGGVQTTHAEQEISRISRHLKVDPVRGTNLIDLSYTAGAADQANRELQRIIDAYFEARTGHSPGAGTADFFNGQLQTAQHQLDADQQALTNYGLKHDISELDEEKRLQLARVSTLQDQIAQLDSQIALQRTRSAQQTEQLQNTPARSRGMERTITNQYSQERLNTSLVDLENRRAELVRRYAPSDRQILELDDKIANTKLAISDAAAKPAAENSTEVNPVYQQLSTSIALSQGEISGFQAQRSVLQRQFDQAQNRLDELERSTTDVNALKRNLEQARNDYNLYAQHKSDARLSAELDKMKLFDVSLVQPPYSSGEAIRPRPALYLAVGLLVALLLASLLVVYLETSSGVLYTPGQLDSLTGSRTLATLTDSETVHGSDEANALEYRRLLYSIHRAMQDRRLDPHGTSILPLYDSPHGEWPRGAIAQDAYVIAITSSVRHEGVSYVAEHLAQEAARQFGSQVAVIDVREMLRRFEEEQAVRFGFDLQEPGNYWVLANGTEKNSAWREIGSRGNFAARLCPWINRAREEMDLILLDCPSNMESTLASEVEPCVDGYVAVVRAGGVRTASVEQLTATLSDRRVPVLGYLLNRRTYPVPRWLHRLI